MTVPPGLVEQDMFKSYQCGGCVMLVMKFTVTCVCTFIVRLWTSFAVYTLCLDLLVPLCGVHKIHLYPTNQISVMCTSLPLSLTEFFFSDEKKI